MPFAFNDVSNTFYNSIQESVPTSSSDTSTSRITIPSFINILTYVIRKVNSYSPFIQNLIIPVVAGQNQYQLSSDFIEENSIRYKGVVLIKTNTTDDTFLITNTATYPWQYSIFQPGTNSSALAVTGNAYLIVDPAPSQTSPSGTPPIFPTFNDPWLMVTYRARIPTDFTTSNYTTYTFNLPEEYHPMLSDLCTAYLMSVEGKDNTFANTFKEVATQINKVNAYVMGQAEVSPPVVNPSWYY